MRKKLTEEMIMKTVDWAYGKASKSAPKLAESYISKGGSKIDMVNSLIRWQNTKAGTSGFLTGLGGAMTMPVGIPANIASVLYVQIKMIAAIAYIGGYDLDDDKVKTLIYTCLAGNGAKDILKETGIVLGKKLTTEMIKKISGKTLTAINRKVGFRLLTKFGEKGVVNLGKMVPLIGGFIGLGFDSVSTNVMGNFAKKIFINEEAICEKNS